MNNFFLSEAALGLFEAKASQWDVSLLCSCDPNVDLALGFPQLWNNNRWEILQEFCQLKTF